MALIYTRKEVENELRDCYEHRAIRAVSLISGIRESYLDRGINPNDEHKNSAYKFLQEQCALDEYNAEMGEKHWQKIVALRAASLPMTFEPLSLPDEMAATLCAEAKEAADCLSGKSLDQLLADEIAVKAHHQKLQDEIIRLLNVDKSNGNGNVSFETRDIVHELPQVRARRK